MWKRKNTVQNYQQFHLMCTKSRILYIYLKNRHIGKSLRTPREELFND